MQASGAGEEEQVSHCEPKGPVEQLQQGWEAGVVRQSPEKGPSAVPGERPLLGQSPALGGRSWASSISP